MDTKLQEAPSCDINAKQSCCCSDKIEVTDFKKHWNASYENSSVDHLAWYEEVPSPSLQLIAKAGLDSKATIFNAGAGATTLIDELLSKGFENIIINDLSSSALEILKKRLGQKANKLQWIEDDLTKPQELLKMDKVDLWHDRAVLHFFHTAEEQKTYFDLVRKAVKPGGYVIIAAFNHNGATTCSGLPVFRYNEEMIQKRIGDDFELVEAFNYTYQMPSKSTREYVYTLFKRMR